MAPQELPQWQTISDGMTNVQGQVSDFIQLSSITKTLNEKSMTLLENVNLSMPTSVRPCSARCQATAAVDASARDRVYMGWAEQAGRWRRVWHPCVHTCGVQWPMQGCTAAACIRRCHTVAAMCVEAPSVAVAASAV